MDRDARQDGIQRALRRREEMEAVLRVVCLCGHRRLRHQMGPVSFAVGCMDCVDCADFVAAT